MRAQRVTLTSLVTAVAILVPVGATASPMSEPLKPPRLGPVGSAVSSPNTALVDRAPTHTRYSNKGLTVKRSASTAVPRPAGSGAARLVADYEAGRISPARFGRLVLALQHRLRATVPAKYRDRAVTEHDFALLGAHLAKSSQRLAPAELTAIRREMAPTPAKKATSSRLTTSNNSDCSYDPIDPDRLICRWTTDHFKLAWDVAGPYKLDDFQLEDTSTPSDGIPDWIVDLNTALNESRDFYMSMGYGTGTDPQDPSAGDLPSDGLNVEVSADPLNFAGYSHPGDPFGDGVIGLPKFTTMPYLPAHELFHHFQYGYTGWPLTYSANWFQEASAEWAAGRFLSAKAGRVPDEPVYARNVPLFLSEPARRLNETDGLSGSRQYGALVFVDSFTARYGQDFVKNVLATFRQYGAVINEAEGIESTVAGYGGGPGQ